MSAVIKVDDLWKRYWLRHGRAPGSGMLREEIARWAGAPFRWLTRAAAGRAGDSGTAETTEEFWALKGISFEVQQSEVIGIIGSNGAGKSTLLKILSRITEPSKGRVEITGRVASLLEVGTGFHPELTGRENIFLNGAILGMSRAEIRQKFDEIVAFAEIEKFLDTPVKRYSSGMYVRLAFAVAAHLEPEILVVDEVLAVGDAQFQRKCLGKMQDVSTKGGRTVLFVSHQMGTVRQLCPRSILLRGGEIAQFGATNDVIHAYLEATVGGSGNAFVADAKARSKDVAIESGMTMNATGQSTSYFIHTEPITISVSCRVNKWVPNTELRLVVVDARGRRVFTSDVDLQSPTKAGAIVQADAVIPEWFLRPGSYVAGLYVFVNNQVVMDSVDNALSFVVQDGGSKYAASEGIDYGMVFAPCRWKVSVRSDGEGGAALEKVSSRTS
jgi:lipopolysaccharide transport system ATP-binding protein